MRYLLIVVFTSLNSLVSAQQLKGKVLNRENMPLAYVNVGIVGGNIGAVTNENGQFNLNLSAAKSEDTLRFSMIGYKSRSYLLIEISNVSDLIVTLEESVIELKEVVIISEKNKNKEIGSKGISGFMQTGWGMRSFGGERGTKISVKKKCKISEFHFYVSNNKYDSVLLRLRIRKLKNGLPDADSEFLSENIFIVDKSLQKGWRTKDISRYDIVLKGDAAITLELIKYWGKCEAEEECFNISMAVPGGTFYYKTTSFSKWNIKKGRSPSLYLTGVVEK